MIEVDLIFSIFIGRLNIGSLELEVRFMGGAEEVEGDEEIIGIFVVILLYGAGYILRLFLSLGIPVIFIIIY